MAPPIINDDKLLLEIARITLRQPKASFSTVCNLAMARVSVRHHSDDASRRRLQRKFSKTRSHWIAVAQEERRKFNADQQERLAAVMAEQARRIEETARPMREAIQRNADSLRGVQEAIRDGLEKVAEQMRPAREAMMRAVEGKYAYGLSRLSN